MNGFVLRPIAVQRQQAAISGKRLLISAGCYALVLGFLFAAIPALISVVSH